MWHVLGRREMFVWCWWENLKERDHLGDLCTRGRIYESSRKWFGLDWINDQERDK
jgi:hypothetical protein